MTLDNPKVIKVEQFPAIVTGPALKKKYNEVLAVVTDSTLYIATADPSGKERHVIAEKHKIYSITGSGNRRKWEVALDDADKSIVTIEKSQGCGCGSTLRGLRIFRGIPYDRVK